MNGRFLIRNGHLFSYFHNYWLQTTTIMRYLGKAHFFKKILASY
jgi:hypothetical protein